MGMNIKMDLNVLEYPLLRLLNADTHLEKAVMDIAKMVCTCGRERDVISFVGEVFV